MGTHGGRPSSPDGDAEPARPPTAWQPPLDYLLGLHPDLDLAARFLRGEVDADGRPITPDVSEPAPAQGTGAGSLP
jgi:hypothetical protein